MERAPQPDVLSYAQRLPRTPTRRRQLARLALASPVLALPFLDLACSVSPFEAAMEWSEASSDPENLLIALGWGFFAGWLAFGWRAVLIARPQPGRRAMALGASMAVVAWAPFAVTSVLWPREALTWLADGHNVRSMIEGTAPFAAGAILGCIGVLLGWRQYAAKSSSAAITTWLTSAFLANAACCLVAFYGDANAGYYVTAYMALLWMTECASLAWRGQYG